MPEVLTANGLWLGLSAELPLTKGSCLTQIYTYALLVIVGDTKPDSFAQLGQLWWSIPAQGLLIS